MVSGALAQKLSTAAESASNAGATSPDCSNASASAALSATSPAAAAVARQRTMPIAATARPAARIRGRSACAVMATPPLHPIRPAWHCQAVPETYDRIATHSAQEALWRLNEAGEDQRLAGSLQLFTLR